MLLDTLIAEREIYRQLITFARAMDERDWETMESMTTSDLTADFGLGEIRGNTAVIESIQSFLDHCGTTQHLLGNILIDVAGDQAISKSYVADMHLCKDTKNETYFRTLGDYTDKWLNVEGTWLMTQRIKDNRATMGTLDVFKP
jgi:hypothetical protein